MKFVLTVSLLIYAYVSMSFVSMNACTDIYTCTHIYVCLYIPMYMYIVHSLKWKFPDLVVMYKLVQSEYRLKYYFNSRILFINI